MGFHPRRPILSEIQGFKICRELSQNSRHSADYLHLRQLSGSSQLFSSQISPASLGKPSKPGRFVMFMKYGCFDDFCSNLLWSFVVKIVFLVKMMYINSKFADYKPETRICFTELVEICYRFVMIMYMCVQIIS